MRGNDATTIQLAGVQCTDPGDLTFRLERVPPFMTNAWATCDACGDDVGPADGDCVTLELAGQPALHFHTWCFDHYVSGLHRFQPILRRRGAVEPVH